MAEPDKTVSGFSGIGASRGAGLLLTIAATMIVVAGIKSFAASIGPIFLALVIVVVVSPIQDRLVDLGAPSWAGFTAFIVAAFGTLAVIVASVAWAAFEMIDLVTSDGYTEQLRSAQTDAVDWLEDLGVEGADVEEIVRGLDIGAVAGQVSSALSGLLGIASAASLLLFTMLFMTLDAGKFTGALQRASDDRPEVVEGLQGFAQRTRSYFIVSTIFGLIVAGLDMMVLLWFNIPLALVWGILSLITNYIPNIGFALGLVPPAILAFFEGGWQLSLWIIGSYLIINVVVQSLIQPRFVGDAVGLSATLTFLSLIFWSWVLGPLGAILAVPMTLLAKALFIDIDPLLQWSRPLISLTGPYPGLANQDLVAAELSQVDEIDETSDGVDGGAAPPV